MSKLLVKKLNSEATLPVKGSEGSAGVDLFSMEYGVIPKRSSKLFDTGVSIMLPAGTYGRIASRSGMALNCAIEVGAGVIDSDYRGAIKVILRNHGSMDYFVLKGQKIAQLICERYVSPAIEEVESLPNTVRGDSGFGSTGE